MIHRATDESAGGAAYSRAVRPLLSLIMIVRDEAKTILRTLASALPFVDRFTILDTGSKDDTSLLIDEASRQFNTPGRIFTEPFVDFSTSRNRCIELANSEATYYLSMDANDELRNGSRLVDWCDQYQSETAPSYHSFLMRVHWNHETFSMTRVFRSDSACRYVGAVHEYLQTREPASLTIEDAYIYHDRGLDAGKSQERWLRDCTILEKTLKEIPNDPRSLFYLAQSYVAIGRYADGFDYYSKRVALGGNDEESYEAMYRRAELAERFLDLPWFQVERMYQEAHSHSPERAEPLVRMGLHCLNQQDFDMAYRLLLRACELPEPAECKMNVDLELYRYGRWDLLGAVAYYVERYEEGVRAIRTALRFPGLGPEARWQLEQNLKVYEVRRSG